MVSEAFNSKIVEFEVSSSGSSIDVVVSADSLISR